MKKAKKLAKDLEALMLQYEALGAKLKVHIEVVQKLREDCDELEYELDLDHPKFPEKANDVKECLEHIENTLFEIGDVEEAHFDVIHELEDAHACIMDMMERS